MLSKFESLSGAIGQPKAAEPTEDVRPRWAAEWPNVYRAAQFAGGELLYRAGLVFGGIIHRYDGDFNFMDVHTLPQAKPTSSGELLALASEFDAHARAGGLGSSVMKPGADEARFAAQHFTG